MAYGVLKLGRLRRPGAPGANIFYSSVGLVHVEGEDRPLGVQEAAAWVRASGGWLRVSRTAKAALPPAAQAFVRACRAGKVG